MNLNEKLVRMQKGERQICLIYYNSTRVRVWWAVFVEVCLCTWKPTIFFFSFIDSWEQAPYSSIWSILIIFLSQCQVLAYNVYQQNQKIQFLWSVFIFYRNFKLFLCPKIFALLSVLLLQFIWNVRNKVETNWWKYSLKMKHFPYMLKRISQHTWQSKVEIFN